ncbi:MAG: alpha/beta hydrolase [Caldilineaceae bacterium]
MNNWQSNFIQTNGIRLHYHRTGGDKPALVMLHGITDNGLCWTRVARALEDEYDCLLVDARGHGLSDKPENGYTAADYAADFAGLIEGLALGPALVIGHSLGAANAASLIANHPHLVRGAVLEDPPWRDESDPQKRMTPAQSAAWMDDWRASLIAKQQLSAAEIMAAGREQSPTWHADEFPSWAEAQLQVYPGVLGKSQFPAWTEVVPQLSCPALLVTGDSSRGAIVTQELAAKVCAANPTVSHVHIPNTGHSIRREGFDEYVAAVRAFLAALSQ